MSASLLPQAPGASAAKTTGILSLVFGFLCFPVGLILAIVALVQHHKAKRAVAVEPEAYQPVGSVGLVTAIVGLVLPLVMMIVGIISAIAIPALLGQRERARDRAALSTLASAMGDLAGEYDRLADARTPREAIPAQLEAKLRTLGAETRNPWNPAVPAFSYAIEVVDGATPAALTAQAEARATEKGVVVFVIAPPDAARTRSGYLAGAVRVSPASRLAKGGSNTVSKLVELP
jgi:type II secretory pathway pseudopilin PulG